MPSIMTLQGLRGNARQRAMMTRPMAGALAGLRGTTLGDISDVVVANPWLLVFAGAMGAFFASKYGPSWGGNWGSHHEAHAREKSLTGRRRKR